jgi:hypothetical protein
MSRIHTTLWGYAVAKLVEALRHNAEGGGFDFRWGHWLNISGRTEVLGSIEHLTEMSTKVFSGGKGGRCLGLTTVPPSCDGCLGILGAWVSWSPRLLHYVISLYDEKCYNAKHLEIVSNDLFGCLPHLIWYPTLDLLKASKVSVILRYDRWDLAASQSSDSSNAKQDS